MGKHKLLKGVVLVAAAGGLCYAFKDKIKNTKAYKAMNMDEKVEKAKATIKEKIPMGEDSSREYFSLNDEDTFDDQEQTEDEGSEEAATVSEPEEPVDEALEDESEDDAPEIDVTEEDMSEH